MTATQPDPSPATQNAEPPSHSGCIIAIGIAVGIGYLISNADTSSPPKPAPTQKVVTVASLERGVEQLALEPLASKYDLEGYKKLGKVAWGLSNDLRRWVALAALQSDSCDKVATIAVSERATRSDLAWHVACANRERFIISEKQARSIKARFDPLATPAEKREHGAELAVAQPMSAVWKSFDETGAVVDCEKLLKDASINRNSFDTSGLANVQRNEETGQATIYRDFSSDNAMGGTVSGKYQCVVDARDQGRVLSLKTQDAFGIHVIFDRR